LRKLFVILSFLLLSLTAKAQYGYTSTVSGNINVYAIQSLTITGGSSIPSFTTLNDYVSGVTVDDYISIGVKSNVSWTLSVMAQSAYFAPMSLGGSTDMPCSVVSLKSATAVNYMTLSTNAQTLKTGSKGGLTWPGNSFNVDMKYNPGFSFKGGIYTLGIVYTLTQQ